MDFEALELRLADMDSSGVFDTGDLAQRVRALQMAGRAAPLIDKVRLARDIRDAKGDQADVIDQFIFAHLAFLEAQDWAMTSQPSLDRISNKISDYTKDHKAPLGREGWPPGEGPDEYQALNAAFDVECDRLIGVRIAESDAELGELFANDQHEFMSRLNDGQALYDQHHGP